MKLTNKNAFYITVVLIAIDFILLMIMLSRPQQDHVNGGLGQGILGFYILVGIIFLLMYGSVFLQFYKRKYFKAVQVMTWFAMFLNGYIFLVLISTMF